MSVLFVSDLHLEAERPDITRAFLHFLEQRASQAEALYILGDFFEVWIGDDGIHVERWVLADWHEDRGEALAWDGEALTREAILPES